MYVLHLKAGLSFIRLQAARRRNGNRMEGDKVPCGAEGKESRGNPSAEVENLIALQKLNDANADTEPDGKIVLRWYHYSVLSVAGWCPSMSTSSQTSCSRRAVLRRESVDIYGGVTAGLVSASYLFSSVLYTYMMLTADLGQAFARFAHSSSGL